VLTFHGRAGTTAIVTGGAGGIGRAVVERLTAAGAQVWTFDVETAQPRTRNLQVDITDDDQVAEAVAHVVSDSGGLQIVVHCAGYLGPFGPFEQLPPEEWARILATNLAGVLQVTRRTVPHLRAAGWGRIVTVGSLAGKHGLPNMSVYSAASRA